MLQYTIISTIPVESFEAFIADNSQTTSLVQVKRDTAFNFNYFSNYTKEGANRKLIFRVEDYGLGMKIK